MPSSPANAVEGDAGVSVPASWSPDRFSPALASRSWIRRVSSSCRVSWIFVYSSVILIVLWPAIFDASMQYQADGIPLVVIAGKEYGTGSSRDWAAKGPRLLGVRAVIAESFERIHRSNLIGMGILPLVFAEGMTWQTLDLTGMETVSLQGLSEIKPGQWIEADITYINCTKRALPLRARIDTFDELDYFRNGGILHYVLRSLVRDAA